MALIATPRAEIMQRHSKFIDSLFCDQIAFSLNLPCSWLVPWHPETFFFEISKFLSESYMLQKWQENLGE